jgi:hypothetical protein
MKAAKGSLYFSREAVRAARLPLIRDYASFRALWVLGIKCRFSASRREPRKSLILAASAFSPPL